MDLSTMLANVGLMINDLLGIFSVLGCVLILMRPKQTGALYDWVMAAFVIGVACQMSILLSGKEVKAIGAAFQFSPGVINAMFILDFFLLVVIIIRRVRSAQNEGQKSIPTNRKNF